MKNQKLDSPKGDFYWAAIKPTLYGNVVLHENDKLTRTDREPLINTCGPLLNRDYK